MPVTRPGEDGAGVQRIEIVPVAKPRMTRRDRWRRRPGVLAYRAYCDELRLRRVWVPECGACVTFVLPMPRSWSQARRRQQVDQPHRCKPDLDNLVKGLLDALYEDDSCVHDLCARKRWGKKGWLIVAMDGLEQTGQTDLEER